MEIDKATILGSVEKMSAAENQLKFDRRHKANSDLNWNTLAEEEILTS